MKVVFTKNSEKELGKIPQAMRRLIIKRIAGLMDSSTGDIKKLSNREGYRLRSGNYRIIYKIDNKSKTITILTVAHRKDAYRSN